MRPDIVNLRQFYSSRLGRKVRRHLRGFVRRQWPAESGLHLVGIGYTTDLLPLPTATDHKNSRIIAMMPVEQGAIYWPIDESNHSVLADSMRPPFMPSSLHRVLMAHHFEHATAPDELLRIWWQLLTPGGRLMLMVPNRHGLWARFGGTPFASGTAYRLADLRNLLNTAGFTLRDVHSALYGPPSAHPLWLYGFTALEFIGALFFPRLGGVLIVEAEKQIYAGVRETTAPAKAAKQWAPAPTTAMTSSKNK